MALIYADSWSLFCGLHNLTCFVTERSVYPGVVRSSIDDLASDLAG